MVEEDELGQIDEATVMEVQSWKYNYGVQYSFKKNIGLGFFGFGFWIGWRGRKCIEELGLKKMISKFRGYFKFSYN